MYILITPTNVFYSKMITPIARKAGVDRRTILRWIDKPHLAKKRGFIVYEAEKAQDYMRRNHT
jgi:hypothetical protein